MRIGHIAIISLACAIGAAGQDKITVPLTNPSQPVTIKASMATGSITVRAGTGREVTVSDIDSGAAGRKEEAPPPGMKRIGGRTGMNIEEDHNVVTISTNWMTGGSGHLAIETPANTNLQLKTVSGGTIEVTGVSGDHEIANMNGSIKLTDVSGSVVAHTANGTITASIGHVAGDKPMSFTSLNGKVDVTLPADTKARLRMKTDNGSIFSDFDVKLEAGVNKPAVEDPKGEPGADQAALDKAIEGLEFNLAQLRKAYAPNYPPIVTAEKQLQANKAKRDALAAKIGEGGKYKITVDRAVTGTINGGGPEYTFQTMNGNILIHKK